MKKWNLIIDVEKCEDCNNCFLACKDEHIGNDWPEYTVAQPLHGQRWINIMRKERGQYPQIDVAYRPTPCMHCDNAPCIKAARDKAIYKRDDGIVIIDPQKAEGQKQVVDSCPYHAIWWNAEKNVPQKCTLCAHLLDDGWTQTRCTQVCPTGALQLVLAEDSAMQDRVAAENMEALDPRLNTRPRVWYRNLYRYTRCFIAGSVTIESNGACDCAAGARVRLLKNAVVIAETTSDSFGDLKFDNLEENSGVYTLEIDYKDFEKKTIEVELKESVSVGDIILGK